MARHDSYITIRTVEDAIEEKLRVLSDFLIVTSENKEAYRKLMVLAIAEHPNTHFDRILDTFAANQYNIRFS